MKEGALSPCKHHLDLCTNFESSPYEKFHGIPMDPRLVSMHLVVPFFAFEVSSVVVLGP